MEFFYGTTCIVNFYRKRGPFMHIAMFWHEIKTSALKKSSTNSNFCSKAPALTYNMERLLSLLENMHVSATTIDSRLEIRSFFMDFKSRGLLLELLCGGYSLHCQKIESSRKDEANNLMNHR